MTIINIIIIGLLVVDLAVILYRTYLQDQVNFAESKNRSSEAFQRKFMTFQLNLLRKHVTWLFVLCASLCICLALVIFNNFQVGWQYSALKKQLRETETELVTLSQRQEDIINETVIQSYPQKGLGIADHNWESIFGADKTPQNTIAAEIARGLSPLLGNTTVLLNVNGEAQQVQLALACEGGAKHNEKLVMSNVAALIKEAEGIQQVTKVDFQVTFTSAKEDEDSEIHTCSYSRENGEQAFDLVTKQKQ